MQHFSKRVLNNSCMFVIFTKTTAGGRWLFVNFYCKRREENITFCFFFLFRNTIEITILLVFEMCSYRYAYTSTPPYAHMQMSKQHAFEYHVLVCITSYKNNGGTSTKYNRNKNKKTLYIGKVKS